MTVSKLKFFKYKARINVFALVVLIWIFVGLTYVQAKIDFLNFFWPEYSKFSIYFRRINRQVPLKKINFSLYKNVPLF
jgi:hypothetical protein